MKLKIDEDNRVLNFSFGDDFAGGVDVQLDPDVEQEFIYGFRPNKYIFKDGKLVEDMNFHANIIQSQTTVDSTTQLALGTISKQVANLTKENTELQQSLGALALQLAKGEK